MSMAETAVIIVSLGFLALTCYVFAPRNRQYFSEMSRIPLDEASAESAHDAPKKEGH